MSMATTQELEQQAKEARRLFLDALTKASELYPKLFLIGDFGIGEACIDDMCDNIFTSNIAQARLEEDKKEESWDNNRTHPL